MSDEKKIIVDEDWKTRVAAEKEALAREAHGERKQAGSDSEDSESSGPAHSTSGAPPLPMPPASFEMLVTTLATEAMIGLGQIPHPLTGKVHADAVQARYAIDMLEMLAAKTKGNLTPGEERGMVDLLHQLRMAFVASQAVSGQSTAVDENEGQSTGADG